MGNVTTGESSTQSPPPTARSKFSTSPSMESFTQWKHPANKVLPDEKPSSPLRPVPSIEASMSDWQLFASQSRPVDSSSLSYPWSPGPCSEEQPLFSFSNLKGDFLRGQSHNLGNNQSQSLEKPKYSARRNVSYPLHGSNHLEYRSNPYIGDYADNKAMFSPIMSPNIEPEKPPSFRRNNLYRKKYPAPSPPGFINHHKRSQGSVRKRLSSPKARRQGRYKKRPAPAPPIPNFHYSNDAVSSQSEMLETPRSSEETVPEPEVDYSDDENEIWSKTTKQTHDNKSVITISPPHSRPGTPPPPPIPPKIQPLLTPSPPHKMLKQPAEDKAMVDELNVNPMSIGVSENLPSPYEIQHTLQQHVPSPNTNDKILDTREDVNAIPLAPPLPPQLTQELYDGSRDRSRDRSHDRSHDSNIRPDIPPPPPLPYFKMNKLSTGQNVSSTKRNDNITNFSKPKPKSPMEKVVKTKTLHEKFKEELEGVFAFRNARHVQRQSDRKPKKSSADQSERTNQGLSNNEINENGGNQSNGDVDEDGDEENQQEFVYHDDSNQSPTATPPVIVQQTETINEQKVVDEAQTDRSHDNKTKIMQKRVNQKQKETESSFLNPSQMTAMLNELKDSILLDEERDHQKPSDSRDIDDDDSRDIDDDDSRDIDDDDNIKDSESRHNNDNVEEAEKTNRSLFLKELTDSIVLLDDSDGDHVIDVAITAPDTKQNSDWTPQDDLDNNNDLEMTERNSQVDHRRLCQKKRREGRADKISGNSKESSLSSKHSNNPSRKSKTESKGFQQSVFKAFDSIKRVIKSRRNSSESDTCHDDKPMRDCICDLDLHRRHHNEACPHSSQNTKTHHVTSSTDNVNHSASPTISLVENMNQKVLYSRQRSLSASCIDIPRSEEEMGMNDRPSINQSQKDNSASRTKKDKRRRPHYHKRTPGTSHLWKDEITHGYKRNKEKKFVKMRDQHLRTNSMDNGVNVVQQNRRLVADGTGFSVISDETGSLNTSKHKDYNQDDSNSKLDDNNNIPVLQESTIYKELFCDHFPEAEKVTKNPLYSSDDEDDYAPNSDHAGKESDDSDISLTSKPTTESPTLEDSGYSCSKEDTRCRPAQPLSPVIEIKTAPHITQKPSCDVDGFTFSPIPIKTMVTPAARAEESGYRSDLSYKVTPAIPPVAVLNITPQIMQLAQNKQSVSKLSHVTSPDEPQTPLMLLSTYDKVPVTRTLLSQHSDQYMQSSTDAFIKEQTEFTAGGGVSVTYHCGQDDDINPQVVSPAVLNTHGDFLDVNFDPQRSNVIHQQRTLGQEIPIPNQSRLYLNSVGGLSSASNPMFIAPPSVPPQNLIIAQPQHSMIASPLQTSMVASTPQSVNPAYHISFSQLQGGYSMQPVATTPVQRRFEIVQTCSTPVMLEQNSSKGQNSYLVRENSLPKYSNPRDPTPVHNVTNLSNPILSTSPTIHNNVDDPQSVVTMTTSDGDTSKMPTTTLAEPNSSRKETSATDAGPSPKSSISDSAKPSSLLYGPRGFKSPARQPVGKWSCVIGPSGSNNARKQARSASDTNTALDAIDVKFSKSGATSPDDIAKLIAKDKDLIAL